MKNLEDKIAVVTGSNCATGYATAKKMPDNGANVFISARRKQPLKNAA